MRERDLCCPLSPFLPSSSSFIPSFCPVQFVVNSQLFFVLFFFSPFPSFPTLFFQFTAHYSSHMVPSWSAHVVERLQSFISTPPLDDVFLAVFSSSIHSTLSVLPLLPPSRQPRLFSPVVYLFPSVFFFVFPFVFSILPSFLSPPPPSSSLVQSLSHRRTSPWRVVSYARARKGGI